MDAAELQREIAALRESLRDAEEVCRAIKGGEVDAVVVDSRDEDKRVLLMSGAYARYRQIVEDMAQGAITLSAAGEILFANHGFARMVGESLLDLFRTPLSRWVAEASRSALPTLLAPRPGQRDTGVTFVRRDGSSFAARISVVSSSDDFVTLLVTEDSDDEAQATLEAIRSGSVDAFVIGEKEVMLLESVRSPYRMLVEQMRQGAVTTDIDGAIAYANERFCLMTGTPQGRLVGKALHELVAESDHAAFQTLLSARGSSQIELRLRSAGGERPLVLATVTPLDGQRLFLFSDLAEQRRHEAYDERTRKFLGILAHEFRNIIGPISNSAVVLKRTQALDADGKKAVETIERQVGRLLGLVEDLRKVNPKE